MNSQDVIKKIAESFSAKIRERKLEIAQPFVRIDKKAVHEIIKFLKESADLKFDFLRCVTGVDRQEKLEIVYHLYSYTYKHEIVVKADIEKESPKIDSIFDLYGIANWYERETFDLLGIEFNNHPDLRRIMLPDDWEGNPLRKDYVYPKEYRGIKHER